MDFDDAGNIYFIFSDSSTGNIGGYSYTSGINVVKIDTSGNVEYIVIILNIHYIVKNLSLKITNIKSIKSSKIYKKQYLNNINKIS